MVARVISRTSSAAFVTILLLSSLAVAGGLAIGCGSEDEPHTSARPGDDDDDDRTGDRDGSTAEGGVKNDGATPAKACPAPGTPGYSLETVTSNGQPRSYGLFVPASYDATVALPVVFAFHGDGEQGVDMRAAGLEEASAGGAIVVYPNGEGATWDLETPPGQNTDYVFFDDLLADVGTKVCVDTSRAFVFGMSRGGFFANQLGCFRGDKIRGLVAHSGGGPYSNNASDFDDDGTFNACTTPAPAALVIHGMADTDVLTASGEKSARYWRLKNGCGDSLNATDPSPCVAYAGCPAGHPVVWCAVDGLKHELWSSAGTASWGFFRGL